MIETLHTPSSCIKDLLIDKLPVILITDVHGHYVNFEKILNKYKGYTIVCIGDVVNLWSKEDKELNHGILNTFIENKIPTVLGNHDSYVVSYDEVYDITQQHISFLRNLPRGIRLVLPNRRYHYLYHYKPDDLWGKEWPLTTDEFLSTYPNSWATSGISIGHFHIGDSTRFARNGGSTYKEFEFIELSRIGALCDGYYGVLTEGGIKHCSL